jgi:SAM-dependent methyltransferase
VIKPDYPLGHDAEELARLDTQAALLSDPVLEQLVKKARNCLEIGCGNGANVPLLRKANPRLRYTGIDCAPEAVAAARARFKTRADTIFQVMDGTATSLADGSYDLVFTKLVLWSVGTRSKELLAEARRLLAPGGIFYALEPCNQLIQLHPEKPHFRSWMKTWDRTACERGLDPFIGTKVAHDLHHAGFTHIQTKFHGVSALAADRARYDAILENLAGFYLGPAAERLGLSIDGHEGRAARTDLASSEASDFVMDALFVTWGVAG